jgi:hypothetical protein
MSLNICKQSVFVSHLPFLKAMDGHSAVCAVPTTCRIFTWLVISFIPFDYSLYIWILTFFWITQKIADSASQRTHFFNVNVTTNGALNGFPRRRGSDCYLHAMIAREIFIASTAPLSQMSNFLWKPYFFFKKNRIRPSSGEFHPHASSYKSLHWVVQLYKLSLVIEFSCLTFHTS